MSAEEAAGCGLVAKVVDDLDSSVHQQLETSFLPRSSAALKIACQAARLRVNRALEDDLSKLEHLYLSELMAVPDSTEGIRAFLEKRQPQWTVPIRP